MRGGKHADAYAEFATRFPTDDRVEHDANDLFGSVDMALRGALAELGADAARVTRAGLATQRSSIACWDRQDGTPLTPILSWRDTRAATWLHDFSAHEPRVHEITGLVLSPHYGVSKLRWCLDNEPAVAAAARDGTLAYGPMASFLVYRLLAERTLAADPANASRTLLWDYRDGNWSEELVELFGVPAAPLPVCRPTEYRYGHLAGIEPRIPLNVVTGDQSAAVFAFGDPSPGTTFCNLGTGAFLQIVAGDRPASARGLLSSVVWQDSERGVYVVEGTVNGAGSALEQVREELGITEEELLANTERWFATETAPPLYLNGVSGLAAPFWIPNFPTRFHGEGTPAAKLIAVYESILFLLRANLERAAESGIASERIIVTGGIANSNAMCQGLASLSGVNVFRPDVREASARGLAYLVAGHPADWSAADLGEPFSPRESAELEGRYARWSRHMQRVIDAI